MDIDTLLRNSPITESRERIESVRRRLFEPQSELAPPHIEARGLIGKGSFGKVYLATDRRVSRTIALKVIRFSGDDERSRLDREAHALARLNHPNVVQLYESGVSDRDSYYLALEHVAGEVLDGWLAARPRTLREILQVFLQIARGLLAAHRRSLVHRDFKPSNVMIDTKGQAKILDFGLVKLTEEGRAQARRERQWLAGPTEDEAGSETAETSSRSRWRHEDATVLPCSDSRSVGDSRGPLERSLTAPDGFVGTLPYAAPEQLRGQEVDARSDQFSYCVTMFEACYGFHPFGRSTTNEDRIKAKEERLRRIEAGTLEDAPPVRAVPRWLRGLLLRGMQADPDRRHLDFAQIIETLEQRLAPPSTTLRDVVVGAVLGLGLISGVTAWLWSEREPLVWDADGHWSAIERRVTQAYGPMPRIEEYPRRWREVADELAQRWRPWEHLEEQYRCLREGRRLFMAEVDTLLAEAPGRELFDRRPQIHTANLYQPEGCRADSPRPPSPGLADELRSAQLLHRRGQDAEALAQLDGLRGRIHVDGSLLSGVVDRLRGAVMLAMGSPEAWDVLAMARHGNGGDLRFLVETTLEQAEAGILLGRTRSEVDALLQQAEAWEASLSSDPDTDLVTLRIPALRSLVEGHAMLREGRAEAAAEAYQQARHRLQELASLPSSELTLAYLDLQTAAATALLPDRGAETKRLVERSFAVLRRHLGDEHPRLPTYAWMAARALSTSAHPSEARELLELTRRLDPSAPEATRAEAEQLYLDLRDDPDVSSRPTELHRRAEALEHHITQLLRSDRPVDDSAVARIWYVATVAYDEAGDHRMALKALSHWIESAADRRDRIRACEALEELREHFTVDDTITHEKIEADAGEREIFGQLRTECPWNHHDD